jgi:hypothetical protein
MTGALERQRFTSPVDVFHRIQASLDEVQRYELEHVFSHWTERVRQVRDIEGDSSQEQIFHRRHFSLFLFDWPVPLLIRGPVR